MLKELKSFLMKGSIIDLAVGVVIGGAFGKIINAVVEKLITPLLGLMGDVDFSKQTFKLTENVQLGWGEVVQQIINFVFIGGAIFFALKLLGKKTVEDAPPPSPSEVYLSEIRDLLKEGKGN
jgi:large conductance mechanosensitive channel